eukprot:g3521.t1
MYTWTNTPCKLEVQTNSAGWISIVETAPALFIGAHNPAAFADYRECTTAICAASRGTVRVWNNATTAFVLDENTIFELVGVGADFVHRRFLRNRVETVIVGNDGSFSFRNPPTFMPLLGEKFAQYTEMGEDYGMQPSKDEIDAFLDHLVEHPNTGPFLAKRLMQRLTTSNPSPRYVTVAATAFRTGAYGGHTYSGRSGDLAALVAAILLDREARSSTLAYDPTHGSLREPLLKIMHVLRAMEYKASRGREIQLSASLQGMIGQQAFLTPSVFNFYLAEYIPPGRIEAAKLTSPEGELVTAPKIVGFLNGIHSLVDNGLSHCYGGFGTGQARPGRYCNNGNAGTRKRTRSTSDGVLNFQPVSWKPKEIVAELSMLLTDGRMSEHARATIVSVYQRIYDSTPHANRTDGRCGERRESKCPGTNNRIYCSSDNDGRCYSTPQSVTPNRWDFQADAPDTLAAKRDDALRAALKMVFASSEFHATNVNVEQGAVMRSGGGDLGAAQDRDFKAIIVIFLAGAADSHNLLMPHTCAPVDVNADYNEIRTNVAIPKSNMLPIDATGQPCSKFGLHPALKSMQNMYNNGDLLSIANIGSLVEPMTRYEFDRKTKRRPPGLFAHNVQQRVMHSVHAQYASAKGILGRITDATSQQAQPYASNLFSLVGNVKMIEGSIAPTMVDRNSGISRFQQYNSWKDDFAKLNRPASSSVFADHYKHMVDDALNTTEKLGAMLNGQSLSQSDWPDDGFARQMKQVAKLIKLRGKDAIGMERAGFVVNQGGFDTHTDVGPKLEEIMGYIDGALGKFEAEMRAEGVWDKVTLLTVSDFGRTLTSNGQGTDHAWAGNHFVMGGAVKGKQVLGKFPPSLKATHELNLGRGRLLPTTPWEGMWKGVVEWFGVEPAQMATVLPNAANFPDDQLHGKDEMFVS